MADTKRSDIRVECPCCSARLLIDANLSKVISHEMPARQQDAPDLGHATQMLKEQAARREALFRQSSEDEKHKGELLERKFAEALKKSKDEPVTKPMRDIDL